MVVALIVDGISHVDFVLFDIYSGQIVPGLIQLGTKFKGTAFTTWFQLANQAAG